MSLEPTGLGVDFQSFVYRMQCPLDVELGVMHSIYTHQPWLIEENQPVKGLLRSLQKAPFVYLSHVRVPQG